MISISKTKTRKQKHNDYINRYSGIPVDYEERLEWMVDYYKLSSNKMNEIINARSNTIDNLHYIEFVVQILLELPEGAERPRFRIVTRANASQYARSDPFVHIYTPNAQEDYKYMKNITDEELIVYDGLINTPCIIEYNAYFPTPSSFSITDIFLAEIGLKRPNISKPDWDNIGKKYCDMYNHNIWLDDAMVITGTVNKFYSILPRVEIYLKYLNVVYNKSQYNSIVKRKDYDGRELHYLDKDGHII